MENGKRKVSQPHKFSADLGAKLFMELEGMRRILQDSLTHQRSISRGDVVRLALWRLKLALLVHEGETGKDPVLVFAEWQDVATQIRLDGACPDWLVPGPAESPTNPEGQPRKRGKQ